MLSGCPGWRKHGGRGSPIATQPKEWLNMLAPVQSQSLPIRDSLHPKIAVFRILSLLLVLPSLALAADANARTVFCIKVVAEQKNGLWRPEDTRVGDQIALLELSDGSLAVHEVMANHSLDPKAAGVDSTKPENANRIQEFFRLSGLSGFDFETQLASAKKTELALTGNGDPPMVVGGTTVEVYSDFENTSFRFVCKDLDVVLPHYARYNPELARLLALLEDLGVFRPRGYSFTL
jgi:hypothetical protein